MNYDSKSSPIPILVSSLLSVKFSIYFLSKLAHITLEWINLTDKMPTISDFLHEYRLAAHASNQLQLQHRVFRKMAGYSVCSSAD